MSALPPAGAPAARIAPRDAAFLAFLTLLNVLNFVDRQLLASFANFIVPELGLSNTQFGWLTGFGFIVFYSVMGLFAGALADRVHRPKLVAGAIVLWSGLTAASGRATGFVTLLLPRMLIGVGESVLTPASMSMLADRFPAARLGLASGIYYMGVPIGIGASLLIVGYLEPLLGWRNCFYGLGILGVALALVMWRVPETRVAAPAAPARGASDEPARAGIAADLFGALRRSPALIATVTGGVAFHFILGAAAFDQLWFVQERGFDRTEIAQLTGWIGLVAGTAGNFFGGWAADRWQERTGTGRPMFLFWVGVVMSPLGILYRLADAGSVLFWIGVFGGYFQLGTFYGPTFSTVQELAPPRMRATVVAFYLLALNFVGLGIGITGGGYMVDALAANGTPEPYTKTLLTFTVLSTVAIPAFWIAGRRFFRDRDRLLAEEAERDAGASGTS